MSCAKSVYAVLKNQQGVLKEKHTKIVIKEGFQFTRSAKDSEESIKVNF